MAYTGDLISFQAADFDFSPDSKWLAIADLDLWTGFRAIKLYDIQGKKLTQLGDRQVEDFSPRFSPDGKYLAFLSRRNLTPVFDSIQNHMNLSKDVKVFLFTLKQDTPSPLKTKTEEEGVEAKEEAKPVFGIDLDGLYSRFVELPIAPSYYDVVEFAGDRLLVREQRESEIRFFDFKSKTTGVLATGAPAYYVSADGKRVLLNGPTGMRSIDPTGAN